MKLATPLERSGAAEISSAAAIGQCLIELAAASEGSRLLTLGYSVRGQPLLGLEFANGERPLPRILLVGSHHGGSEPAGGEALLAIARSLAQGSLAGLRDLFDVLIVPDANPDGRDAGTARNANGVNLNRDYVLLSQPETRALNGLLQRWRPQVVLDAHESASFKQHTLGKEGYLTDFECQFDIANHPAIATEQQALSATLLNHLLAAVRERGLPAQRYIREITSIRRPLTHGGYSISRFRNKAALYGALSFLLETPMPPKDGAYASHQDLETRTAKQQLCIETFLHVMAREVGCLGDERHWQPPRAGAAIALSARYVPAGPERIEWLRMRRYPDLDFIDVPFADRRWLKAETLSPLPAAYFLTHHTPAFASALLAHGLVAETLERPLRCEVLSTMAQPPAVTWGLFRGQTRSETLSLEAGSLKFSTAQPFGRLLPVLLEFASPSSLFQYPTYRRLVTTDERHFVFSALGH